MGGHRRSCFQLAHDEVTGKKFGSTRRSLGRDADGVWAERWGERAGLQEGPCGLVVRAGGETLCDRGGGGSDAFNGREEWASVPGLLGPAGG